VTPIGGLIFQPSEPRVFSLVAYIRATTSVFSQFSFSAIEIIILTAAAFMLDCSLHNVAGS
jgi:hypothetical protein